MFFDIEAMVDAFKLINDSVIEFNSVNRKLFETYFHHCNFVFVTYEELKLEILSSERTIHQRAGRHIQ